MRVPDNRENQGWKAVKGEDDYSLQLRRGKCWKMRLPRWASQASKGLPWHWPWRNLGKWTLRFTTLTCLQRTQVHYRHSWLHPHDSSCDVHLQSALRKFLSSLGHFATIKCSYKLQLIGSNVWFPIFLTICVSPVIRVPKCSGQFFY